MAQTLAIRNETRDTVLGERIRVADTSLSRIVGLLRDRSLERGSGLLIYPSQAVHTIGMKFAIDIVFVDRHWRVVAVRSDLEPYRFSQLAWKARSVIELPAGTVAETATMVGDQLSVS